MKLKIWYEVHTLSVILCQSQSITYMRSFNKKWVGIDFAAGIVLRKKEKSPEQVHYGAHRVKLGRGKINNEKERLPYEDYAERHM